MLLLREEMEQGAFWPLGKKDKRTGCEVPVGVLNGPKAAWWEERQ